MSAVLAIALKDLRQRLRDRSVLVIGFIAPVAVAALISMAFGSAGSFHANVAVVDLDGGPVAAGFTTFVKGPDLAKLLTVKPVTSESDARAKVAKGDLSAAFVIPKGFSPAVTSGSTRPFTVLASVDSSIAEQVARSLAESFTAQIQAVQLSVQSAVRAGAPAASVGKLAAEASAVRLPEQTVTLPAGTRPVSGVSYYAPAAVVVVPTTLDTDLRSGGSTQIPVLVTGAVQSSQAAVTAVNLVVARHGATVQAATFATAHSTRSFEQNLAATRSLQRQTPAAPVRTDIVNRKSNFLPLGYNYSAPTMLVLFVFINALAGGAAMIQTRKYGIFARALAAPVRPRDLVLGETLCYFTLALGQALLIVAVGSLLFGVSWGNPLAAAALIGLWALVGTGAGMVSGTLFRTPEQASAIGPAVGIAFGMLGGCMWPLEIVPQSVRLVGHATPHAWAVDAWVTLLSRGGGLVDIAGYLAILAGYAVALFAFASFRLRRSLVTP